MREKKELSIIKRPKLSESQEVLYERIYKRLDSSEPMTANDAIEIWTKYVCRNKVDGVPHTYFYFYENSEDKFPKSKNLPMTDYEIRTRSIGWLMMAIGALVLKGYLKVIPTLELD